MQLKRNASIDETVAFWRSKAKYLIESLETDPSRLRVSDFFASTNKIDGSRGVWGGRK
jgi:hypothetical protein